MALPVLDGNQTATTLSSVVTGGEHIVAHSVVSLGSTAISNIATAVSGANVTVAGTVTANANLSNTFQDEYNTLLISGTLTGYFSDALKGVYFRSVFGYLKSCWEPDGTRPKIDYDFAPSGEYSGQRWRLNSTEFATGDSSLIFYANSNTYVISAVTGWTVVTLSGYSGAVSSQLYFNVPVALNNTESTPIHIVGSPAVGGYPVLVNGTVTIGNSVTIGSLPAISGTVTARLQDGSGNNLTSTSIGGVQRLNVSLASAATPGGSLPTFVNVYGGSDSGTVRAVAVDSSGRSVVTVSNFPATQAVSLTSTTVTVSALPGGALTTRFGSVTTANTAQITSAVTNASRKYLLTQNISAGTVTIGIGFSPTTTQGIQLTAGAGLTFDSFCPTGAVYWLGAVTGAAFTILEG